MKVRVTTAMMLVLFIVVFAAGLSFAQCEDCKDCKDKDHAHHAMVKSGETAEQTICPVMGGEINKEFYADHNGERVYFCCEDCVKAFKEDPDKYVDQLKAEGVTLEKSPVTQTTCPVSGKPVNTEVFTDHEGERVYFCCNGCKAKFEKNPTKYLKKS